MRKLVLTIAIATVIAATVGSTAQAKDKRVYTGDFITATNIVGKYYGIRVKNWLVSCSSGEGGHGSFVWFGHHKYPIYGYSTTPGGWMQFMGSTFRNNLWWTIKDARSRGLKIHPKARSYYEPLGQALVAGVMYYHYGNPGTWTGYGC